MLVQHQSSKEGEVPVVVVNSSHYSYEYTTSSILYIIISKQKNNETGYEGGSRKESFPWTYLMRL